MGVRVSPVTTGGNWRFWEGPKRHFRVRHSSRARAQVVYQPSRAPIGTRCLERSLNRQFAMERHFYFVGLSTCCKPTRDGEDPSRLRMAPLTVLSPGPRLAGMPARGEERNDSNGRKGYEAENGSEWQSVAVFRQRRDRFAACGRGARIPTNTAKDCRAISGCQIDPRASRT
jgi:hypothetical protein